MFQDKLTLQTQKLLKTVKGVTTAINEKKRVILDAEKAINDAKNAIDKAKQTLSIG